MTEPKVAIIILNWNNREDTLKCLKSVKNLNYSNYSVYVVDNGSTDGSQDAIKKNFPDVILIENKENLGFAKGNNIGIKIALQDKKVKYIFLLNNDTIVEPNCLKELIRVAESDNRVGMVQPKMLRMDNSRVIDSTGHVFKWGRIIDRGQGEEDKGQYDDKLDIIGCCAGAGLYRREMLEDIGLFNEDFWMYYEDAELSWRAYKKGWKAKYVPQAIVYHKRGGTTKKSAEIALKMTKLNLRNISITVKKHGTLLQKLLFGIYLIFIGIKSEIGKQLGKNRIGALPYFDGLLRLLFSEKFYQRWNNADNYWRYYYIIKFIKKKRNEINSICEVGCGQSGITNFLKLKKPIVGIDINFGGRPLDSIEPILASATNLPFKDNTFDLVFSIDMLEHIPPRERKKVIEEMIRISNKYIIIGFPCDSEVIYYEKKANELYKKLNNRDHKWLIEHLENRLPTRDEIRKILKKFNFKEINNVNLKIWYINIIFDIILSKLPIGHVLSTLKNWILSRFLAHFIHFGKTYRVIFIIEKN